MAKPRGAAKPGSVRLLTADGRELRDGMPELGEARRRYARAIVGIARRRLAAVDARRARA